MIESRLRIFSKKRDDREEVFLTYPVVESDKDVKKVFTEIFQQLKEKKIEIVQEKIYGRLHSREKILNMRHEVAKECELSIFPAVQFYEGMPFHEGSLAGVQIWGVRSLTGERGIVTTTKSAKGNFYCNRWSLSGKNFCYLPFLSGLSDDGHLPEGVSAQAENMFINAQSCLDEFSLTFRHVPRAWVYMRRILDWYGEFNRIRNEFFKNKGLIGGSFDDYLPASTGIQMNHGQEESFLELLALDSSIDEGGFSVIRPDRQNEAFCYGSAFSRGTAINYNKGKTLLISGTASINTEGKTVHIDEYECQVMETLLAIGRLIESENATLEDISQATLFCKDEKAYEAYLNVFRLLKIPDMPVIPMRADVCRSDLLIEIEAIALL